jgi:integrase
LSKELFVQAEEVARALGISKLVREMNEELKQKGFLTIPGRVSRCYFLRHTAATVAIASGADIKSVQNRLGHAAASFTLDVYAHTSEQMMKDRAARMQSYYDGPSAKGN